MKEAEINRREELNKRETEEIASVLEGARPSNRIDVDREELREHLNHLLTEAGLIHPPEDDDEDPAFEEAFVEYASEPESARELRDQYQELADLIDRIERKLRRHDLVSALAARVRWLSARRPQGARYTANYSDKLSGVQILHLCLLLKQAAEDLSKFKASQIKTGRPRDELLDVLVVDLAEVYLAFRPESGQIADLSASPRSLFLRFCFNVLCHFFSREATKPETLAQRWRHLRKSLRDTEGPLGV